MLIITFTDYENDGARISIEDEHGGEPDLSIDWLLLDYQHIECALADDVDNDERLALKQELYGKLGRLLHADAARCHLDPLIDAICRLNRWEIKE